MAQTSEDSDLSDWITLFDSRSEAEKIFSSHEVKRIIIDGHAVCFGRLGSEFYAIDDECPHQNASLGMGECKPNGSVECPFHHYLFDLKTGAQIGGLCPSVKSYPVRMDDSGVFINLG